MICPYLTCQGKVQKRGSVGRCGTCPNPVFFCPGCEAANRSFALWCRRCGREIFFPTRFEDKNGQSSSWDFSRESRIISLLGEFWTAPVSFKGTLWCLSTADSLLCLCPGNSRPTAFVDLGMGYGNAPGVMCEVGPRKVPYFLAAGRSGVKGVNLLTGGVADLILLRTEEVVLSDMSESYSTIAADSERFFFLLRQTGKVFLAVGSFDQGLVATHELPGAERCAGPIKVGGWVAAYSQEKLYLLEEEKLHETPFRNGFRAWDVPGHVGDLRPPAGHLPYLATADALYIPGELSNTPTLLRVTSPETFAPLVSEEGVYLCDSQGHLLGAIPVFSRH